MELGLVLLGGIDELVAVCVSVEESAGVLLAVDSIEVGCNATVLGLPSTVIVAVVSVLMQIGALVTVKVTPGAIVMIVLERTDVWISYGMRLTVTPA